MAILFNNYIRNTWCYNLHISSSSYDPYPYSYWGVTIYSGAQPSAATILASPWSTYNSTFLIHWQSAQLITYNAASTANPLIQLANAPTSTANASGTATWAIMWASNPNQATVAGATLPTPYFLVLPVSDNTGTGVVRLASTSITSGSPYSLNNFVLSFGGGI